MINYMTILVLIYILLPSMSYANFFEQRYRGWLWFEEKMTDQDMLYRPNTKDRARSGKVIESAELRNDFHS